MDFPCDCVCVASLKNIGEKTAGLFDRKKKEMEEKAAEAQTYAEEQARKAGEVLDQTKKEAGELLDGAGKLNCFDLYPVATTLKFSVNNFFPFSFDFVAGDAEKAKHDLSEFAEEAKTTGASMFDHAKGAATAAIAAGSKAAEDIADEKLKQAESVSFFYHPSATHLFYLKSKFQFVLISFLISGI